MYCKYRDSLFNIRYSYRGKKYCRPNSHTNHWFKTKKLQQNERPFCRFKPYVRKDKIHVQQLTGKQCEPQTMSNGVDIQTKTKKCMCSSYLSSLWPGHISSHYQQGQGMVRLEVWVLVGNALKQIKTQYVRRSRTEYDHYEPCLTSNTQSYITRNNWGAYNTEEWNLRRSPEPS